MPSAEKAEWHGKVSNYQINQKYLILNATYRDSVRPVVAVHVGIAAVEVQAPRVGTTYGTRPIVAAATHIAERTIAVAAVACHGQFKRRAKSPC